MNLVIVTILVLHLAVTRGVEKHVEEIQEPKSGLWSGHYVYNGKNYQFKMELAFSVDGRLAGEGTDGIGKFSIDGTWKQQGRLIRFVKQYIGKHQIFYEATYNAKGDFISGLYSKSGHFEMKFVGSSQSKSVEKQVEEIEQPKSGLWSGHYVQNGKKHQFQMKLMFSSEGKVTGGGTDGIGKFSIDGTWKVQGRSMSFIKKYIGKHRVSYEATYNAKGDLISGLYFGSGHFEMKFVGSSRSKSVEKHVEEIQQPKSGLWSGHYVYNGKNYQFKMELAFSVDGRLAGEGTDGIGKFSIDGTWKQLGRSIRFVKQYIGKHKIFYEATYNAKGDFISGLYSKSGHFEMKFVGSTQSKSVEKHVEEIEQPKSGLWSGHYVQNGKNHQFEMKLMFSSEGKVTGGGTGGIGKFSIDGTWKLQGRSMSFIKQYIGKHRVSYEATYNAKGDSISGRYFGSGKFEMKFVGSSQSKSVERHVEEIEQPKSGLWSGHYVQNGKKHQFEMKLMFSSEGKVTGGGTDGIGKFSIDGTWKQQGRSMSFIKQYIGKHSVSYEATYNAKGDSISGLYFGWGKFEMKFVGSSQSKSVERHVEEIEQPKSGLWSGHYVQNGKKHQFEMKLMFSSEGKVTGGGTDGIGKFSIDGTWKQQGRSMSFIKQYIGKHSVSFEATYNAKGDSISGLYFGWGKFEMKFVGSSQSKS